jgi:hypothetical protein
VVDRNRTSKDRRGESIRTSKAHLNVEIDPNVEGPAGEESTETSMGPPAR